MNDIDLSSIDNWAPIGDATNKFTGTFDGNGHVIKNLKIDRSAESNVGLFGRTSNATIKNVGLENVDINGGARGYYIGGLIGFASGSAISNCYVTGNITANGSLLGGIVGTTSSSTISNCYFSGNIIGNSCEIGGLAGNIDKTSISNCYNAGSITASLSWIGGIVGTTYHDSSITNCYNTGKISGEEVVGGIAGAVYDNLTISNCYNGGSVAGKESVGGIIGETADNATISNCYTTKNITGIKHTGNFVGFAADTTTVSNCKVIEHSEFTSPEFWDKQNLDSDIWEMSVSIPPVLKGVGKNNYNWYFRESNNDFRLQVGSGTDPAANAMFVNTGLDLGAINVDLSTVEGCLNASNCAKAALDAVAKRTADIGIEQSRLETINNVNATKIENLSAAYSTVTSADEAEEIANYTKAQIMAQTTVSLITQVQAFQVNLLMRMINSLG